MPGYEELKQHFTIPDAWEAWRGYRGLLTDYLRDLVDREPIDMDELQASLAERMQTGPTLAILGAGRMQDLDLQQIRESFAKITLIDQDLEAMQEAVSWYGLEEDTNLYLIRASLNGIGEEEYRSFYAKLSAWVADAKETITVAQLDTVAIEILQELYEQAQTPFWGETAYDYIWCVGVHSQLQAMPAYIYTAIWETLVRQKRLVVMWEGMQAEESAFMAYLKEQNTRQIQALHDKIIRQTRQCAIIGCELCRCEKAYTGMRVNPDCKREPIEGAMQGIADLDRRGLYLQEYTLCWPFYERQNICYDMLLREIPMVEQTSKKNPCST